MDNSKRNAGGRRKMISNLSQEVQRKARGKINESIHVNNCGKERVLGVLLPRTEAGHCALNTIMYRREERP